MTSAISAAAFSNLTPVKTSNLPKISVDPSLLKQAIDAPSKETPSTPADSVYANVTVNGKVAATLYNSGTLQVPSSAIAAQIQNLPSVLDNTQVGPDSAQERAAAIANALGGTVVKADTAQTQQQYLGSDYEKGRQQIVQSHRASSATLFQAQLFANPAIGWNSAPAVLSTLLANQTQSSASTGPAGGGSVSV
jgi:hypothetical protein